MGSLDCCQRGVKNELVIVTDDEHIQDKEGFPQDTDPAFRSKKIEVENQNENPNENPAENQGEDNLNQEKNNFVMEVTESGMKRIEQNETNENFENNEPNDNMNNVNIPNTDINVVQESNNVEIKEENLPYNENNVVLDNVQNVENIGNEGIDTNNIVQGELNIDQILNNYNEQQAQGNQTGEAEEDYNKYFEQIPSQQNNNDIDINQYFKDDQANQANQANANNLAPMFTFGENQTDVNNLISSNAQTSQEYNYDYNYNVQNA